MDRVFRGLLRGNLGDADLEDRLLRDRDEGRFRDICQTALEGLASKNLKVGHAGRAPRPRPRTPRGARDHHSLSNRERGERFLTLNPVRGRPHTFEPGRTPPALKRYEHEPDWKLPEIAVRYPRLSTDRSTADADNLEWVTPGHPLFEALRRQSVERGQDAFAKGACFHSIDHESPSRLDFYRARVVDGLGQVIHERLFTVELTDSGAPSLREPDILGNLSPAPALGVLPPAASLPEPTAWLNEQALTPFITRCGRSGWTRSTASPSTSRSR